MPDVVTDWARSGVVALTGRSDGRMHVPPGRAASVANELADRFHARTGVALDGAALLAERAAYTGRTRRGAISVGGASRFLPTVDGWAAVTCARPDDPALLGALVGEEVGEDPWPLVRRWLANHSGAELAERATLLGLAATPVGAPPVPYLDRPGAEEGDVRGRLVVDFSALWAGPLCAHLLGLAGARVVKVETPGRPDGARFGNPAFYDLLHAGHRAVAVEPATAEGRRDLARLVERADIVIEASRPRALARFGLHAAAVVANGATWISITAWGRGDARVGFGDDVAAGAGLVAREPCGTPLFCGDALADPLTGLTAAVAATENPGRLLDIPMAGVVAATLDGSAGGPAPANLVINAPRRRQPTGRSAKLGEDTDTVLRALP